MANDIDLDQPTTPFKPAVDRRRHIPEPPPVRLVAVNDVQLPAPAGVERALDDFYVGLLRFERDPRHEFPVYKAENFRLIVDVREPPLRRDDLRPAGIQVPMLSVFEQKLIDAEIEYTRQRGLLPGTESLLLLDPAGNWIEVSEFRDVR